LDPNPKVEEMTHRWEVHVITPTGEWYKTYPTRLKAHVSYHNRYRIAPMGSEIYLNDLEQHLTVKWRRKDE